MSPEEKRKFRLSKMKLLSCSVCLEDSEFPSDNERFEAKFFSDFGLMLTRQDDHLCFQLCPDANFPEIHPNVYAPKAIENMEGLVGGGSGVTVFGGHHPELGDLVMKHGGNADLNELFALATIENELKQRGSRNGTTSDAVDLQRRLPEFKMVYISPSHIIGKKINVLDHLKSLMESFSDLELPKGRRTPILVNHSSLSIFNTEMSIRLYESPCDNFAVQLDTQSEKRNLSFILPKNSSDNVDEDTVLLREESYSGLTTVVDELLPVMTDRLLKFTLCQKKIGGESPRTGNQWLYNGQLNGDVLKNLITHFIKVIRHLQQLTLPEEADIVKQVREELEHYETDDSLHIHEMSDTTNSFVGNAIKKNFKEKNGRIRFLHQIGKRFRAEGLLLLSPEEELPAKLIGALLEEGAIMSDFFLNSPSETAPLNPGAEFWKNILRRAVDTRPSMSPSALKRVWNGGLSDAGIHNLFLTKTDLFLFDLGEPELQSLPGFLTKFLFSFFHTLGMEDGDDGPVWVRRFDVVGDKLELTKETKELLPKAYDAFHDSLDRLVEEVLDGDRELKWLLLQYVTLQLLSDSSFCLQRWTIKGGGRDREHNHQQSIDKWLWRALWDIYIAGDINTHRSWTRFGVDQQQLCARHSLLHGTISIHTICESTHALRSSMRESSLWDIDEFAL